MPALHSLGDEGLDIRCFHRVRRPVHHSLGVGGSLLREPTAWRDPSTIARRRWKRFTRPSPISQTPDAGRETQTPKGCPAGCEHPTPACSSRECKSGWCSNPCAPIIPAPSGCHICSPKDVSQTNVSTYAVSPV